MEHPRTLEDAAYCVSDLSRMLEVTRRMLVEADGYVKPDGSRNTGLDDIASLVAVAADAATRLAEEMDEMTLTYVHKDEATETSTGA